MDLFCTYYKLHCLYLRSNKKSVHIKVLTQTNSTLLTKGWNLNTKLSLKLLLLVLTNLKTCYVNFLLILQSLCKNNSLKLF